MTDTPLDQAHKAMEGSPDNDQLRMQFFDRLVSAELFFLLEDEAQGETITPRLFPVEEGTVALVFDTEERLTELAGPAPYAAMTGRALVALLRGQDIGLGLNLGIAPSSFLLDASGVDWLAELLSTRAEIATEKPDELFAPAGLPDDLISALDIKLSSCTGLASCAYLAGIRYDSGAQSHILAFIDALSGAEDALAQAANEALVFSGVEAGALDVAFFAETDPVATKLELSGLRFDLPVEATGQQPSSPGRDPNNPPTLR